jgi:AraC family transcriptional regulator, transcriptional activator of pobA
MRSSSRTSRAHRAKLSPVTPAISSTLAVRRYAGELRPARTSARHAFTVLAFHVAGEVDVEHGGRLTLRRGDFHVIPAGHAHRVVRAENAEIWGIALATEQLDRARYGEVLEPFERMARGALPTVACPESRRGFVASIFDELASGASVSALRRESLVALLLAEVADHARPALGAAPETRPVDLAARAVAFVASHALGNNRSHVAEVVRRATGRTVGQLITELRVDEARRRLEETDELVEVIGERVGYLDATHFARVFKRHFGLAPRAWRKRVRGS